MSSTTPPEERGRVRRIRVYVEFTDGVKMMEEREVERFFLQPKEKAGEITRMLMAYHKAGLTGVPKASVNPMRVREPSAGSGDSEIDERWGWMHE